MLKWLKPGAAYQIGSANVLGAPRFSHLPIKAIAHPSAFASKSPITNY
jgi:hypothetical protein